MPSRPCRSSDSAYTSRTTRSRVLVVLSAISIVGCRSLKVGSMIPLKLTASTARVRHTWCLRASVSDFLVTQGENREK